MQRSATPPTRWPARTRSTPTSGSRWATRRLRPRAERRSRPTASTMPCSTGRRRRDRAALPARAPGRGDQRGSPLRRAPAHLGPGREPPPRAEGAAGVAPALNPLYDAIGRSYATTRATDPRIAARIWAALGDARTVVNVGAGAGSYEPPDRAVTAVEPSPVMRAQRPPTSGARRGRERRGASLRGRRLRRRDGRPHPCTTGPTGGPVAPSCGAWPASGSWSSRGTRPT